MNVQTTDLVTKDDIADALMRADEGDVIRDKVLADGADFEEEGLETIASVSGRVTDWLSRSLIVGERTDYTSERDWRKKRAYPTQGEDMPYHYHTRQYPILEVTGKSDPEPTLMIDQDRNGLWSTTNTIRYVNYISGYKRPDQSFSDFSSPVKDQLSQGDIPDLPEKIRNVAENIVIYRLIQRLSGLIGVSVSEVSFGEFENTKTKREADQEYEERKLRSLTAGHAAIA